MSKWTQETVITTMDGSELLWYSPPLLVPLCVTCHREAPGHCVDYVQAHLSECALHLFLVVWVEHHLFPTSAFANYPKTASFCTSLTNCTEQESLGKSIRLWTWVMCHVNLKWGACLAAGGWYRHASEFFLGWRPWGSTSSLPSSRRRGL